MVRFIKHCAFCGKGITASFWACAECEERYALPKRFADWPDWAKAVKRLHEMDRRDERRRLKHQVYLDDLSREAVLADAVLYEEQGLLDAQELADDDAFWEPIDQEQTIRASGVLDDGSPAHGERCSREQVEWLRANCP